MRFRARRRLVAGFAALWVAVPAAVAAQSAGPGPSPAAVTFANGALGTAEERCGAGDLCASLKLPNGDAISVYNGGAVRCKPYTLKIVRMHGDTKLFDYDAQTDTQHGFFTAGNCSDTFANTYLTIGNGGARLGIFQNTDGSLFARWEGGSGFIRPIRRPGAAATAPPGPWSDEMIDGHPRTCTRDYGWYRQTASWDRKECAGARERWAAERAASPSPSPSPSN
jgi:hypothetical protein